MSIREHELYKIYESYINYKHKGIGKISLLKKSESNFLEFVENYQKRQTFKNLVDKIYISEVRNEKIDDIFE
jgi:hypothetical protein